MMYKDILLLLIAVPVIVSFIIVTWGIMITLLWQAWEMFSEWRNRRG